MKRFLPMVLLACLLLSLAACTEEPEESGFNPPVPGAGSNSLPVGIGGNIPVGRADGDNSLTQPVSHASLPDEWRNADEVVIQDRLFVAQFNDIYMNADDYMNRLIRYEGIYNEETDPRDGTVYCYVYRYGPGCCGFDSNVGFQVSIEGTPPAKEDWVEVEGYLDFYDRDGWRYLIFRVTDYTVKAERGQETVVN